MIQGYFPGEAGDYLRMELELRQRRNPRYSIRAFARDLDLSPSHLSEFLSGKALLSPRKADDLSSALKLSEEQKEHWKDLIFLKSKGENIRRQAKLRVQKRLRESRSRVSLDVFKIVADWQNFALLAFFGMSPHWSIRELSENLRLSEDVIRQSIRSLVKLELLEKTDVGYRPRSDSSFVGDELPSEAIRESHRQVLGKCVEALDLFGP